MNFDEMIKAEKEKNAAEAKRKQEISTREIAVIGCGANMVGRVSALTRAFEAYEAEVYTYVKFGFTIFTGFGDHGTPTSSHRGYSVTRMKDGSYEVNDVISTGFSHKLHVGIFGCIDKGAMKNPDRFDALFNEACKSLREFKVLYVEKRSSLSTPETPYCRKLKAAFFEKINALAAEAERECGITQKTTLEEVKNQAVRTCRAKRSQSIYDAERNMKAGLADPSGAGSDFGEAGRKILIALLVVAGLAALFALFNR